MVGLSQLVTLSQYSLLNLNSIAWGSLRNPCGTRIGPAGAAIFLSLSHFLHFLNSRKMANGKWQMANGRGRKGQFLERCRCCEMQPPIARNRNGIFRFQENHSGLLRISQASTGASSGASLVREKRPLAYRISSHPVRAPHVAHVGGLRGVTCPQISQSPITTRSPPALHPLATRWPPAPLPPSL